MKVRARPGPERTDAKSVRILSRIVEWRADGIRREADQRHVAQVVRTLGPAEGARETQRSAGGGGKLCASDTRRFRGPVAKLNCVAQDRPGIRYATEEVRRGMSAPTVGGLRKLERVAQNLRGGPRTRLSYKRQ